MDLEACLPPHLRGPGTTITKVAAGLSGAGVYRVDAGGDAFVLKVSDADEPLERWRRAVHVRRLAAEAGVAPRVVHVDESRRAVVSEFVLDRSFPAFYRDPRTHEAALALLGRTVRRVHEIPLPADVEPKDARELLATTWAAIGEGTDQGFAVPPFIAVEVRRLLDEPAPDAGRPPVLSHNDVNPSNLFYDGERILLLDWEVAGPNDPYYDLATASLFLRMDEGTRARLLAAYDGAPVSRLPARFAYDRRLVGVLAAVMFLFLARRRGHPGAAGGETLESTPSLGEFYARLQAGAVSIATAEGQWAFCLSLFKEGVTS